MTAQLSLLPTNNLTPAETRVRLTELPPDDDIASDPPTKGFVDSVVRFGIQHPIALERGANGYKIIHGRRRIRAARLAKLDDIPARIYEAGDVNRFGLALVENEHRSSNQLVDIENILKLRDEGFSDKDIVTQLGLNASVFKSRVRLITGLTTEMLGHFRGGKFRANLAKRIAGLTGAQQETLGGVLKAKGKIIAADVDDAARVGVHRTAAALPHDLFDSPDVNEHDLGDAAAATIQQYDRGDDLVMGPPSLPFRLIIQGGAKLDPAVLHAGLQQAVTLTGYALQGADPAPEAEE